MFQVIPRERTFYDLLERSASGVAEGARALPAMLDDLANGEAARDRISALEHAGDELTHEIANLLNTTFVTPIDRHDIHHLASHLDDVLDLIEAVADLLVLYRIREALPHVRQQAEILVQATVAVEDAVLSLRAPTRVSEPWRVILRAERDGDHVFRRGVAAIYSGGVPPLDVLRWKDILRHLESAIDRCEDIANTVESIALKHA